MVMRLEETPVPIPNTTVKIQSADDTTAEGCGKAGGCRAFLLFYIEGLKAGTECDPLEADRTGSGPCTIKTEYRKKRFLKKKRWIGRHQGQRKLQHDT